VSEKVDPIEPAIEVEQVTLALAAAIQGDVVHVLELLWASGLMDGLVRHVLSRYRDLDPDEAYTALSEAIDDFCAAAKSGQAIRNPKAWLFRVTLIKAYKLWQRKSSEQEVGQLDWQARGVDSEGKDSANRESLILRALSLARSYLPLLGQENVRRVMAFYFDAVERDIQLVEHSEVAAALGITEDTARQCAHRGFKRLKRVAAEKGIDLDTVIPDGHRDDSTEEEQR
jgi:DNA-directed RNA polymerase specialized sigma24 family protein